jgi:cysteine-rich secretory family protein
MRRTRSLSMGALALVVVALAGCVPKRAPAPPPVVVHASGAATTQAIFDDHNSMTGFVPPYSHDIFADNNAQLSADRLASHGACSASALVHTSNLAALYPSSLNIGENLVCWSAPAGCPTGNAAADAAVHAWINSPEHWANMVAFKGQWIGVGAACANGTQFYAVVQFHN